MCQGRWISRIAVLGLGAALALNAGTAVAAPDRCDAAYCYEDVCKPAPPKQDCHYVTDRKCKKVPVRNCGTKESCRQVAYQDCQPQAVQACDTYFEQKCKVRYRPQYKPHTKCMPNYSYPANDPRYIQCKTEMRLEAVQYNDCKPVPRLRCETRTTQSCRQRYRNDCKTVKRDCAPKEECYDEQRQVCTKGAAGAPVCETRTTKVLCDDGETWTSSGCVARADSRVAPDRGDAEPKRSEAPAPADAPPSSGSASSNPPSAPPPASGPTAMSFLADKFSDDYYGWSIGALLAGLGLLLFALTRRRKADLRSLHLAGINFTAQIDKGQQSAAKQEQPAVGTVVTIRSVAGPHLTSVVRG